MAVRSKLSMSLVFLCFASLVLNAALGVRVQTLSKTVRGLTPAPVRAVGTRLKPLTGTDLAGHPVSIVARGKGAVLYVFTPTCHWCQANASSMSAMVEAAVKDGFDVYAISLAEKGSSEFLRAHGVSVPIVLPSPASRAEYGFGGTPQTMVLAADGTLAKNWPGAYRDSTATAVAAFFHTELPGLIQLPAGR